MGKFLVKVLKVSIIAEKEINAEDKTKACAMALNDKDSLMFRVQAEPQYFAEAIEIIQDKKKKRKTIQELVEEKKEEEGDGQEEGTEEKKLEAEESGKDSSENK